jgi:hypothetical protein
MSQHALRNIIYFCVPENRPSGGIKYLLRHSNLINNMPGYGIGSAIHVLNRPDFVPAWEIPHVLKPDNRFNRYTDLIVLPEIMVDDTAPILQTSRVRYSILVQNGFYAVQGASEMARLAELYGGAISIVSTSAEITATLRAVFPGLKPPIFNVNYAFDRGVFSGGSEKRNLITYMPRKLRYHSRMVLRHLWGRDRRGWEVQPIDGLDEAGVVALLKASRIFLSFSDLEGFGLPPVEAALLGNKVIGYTGVGGREYFEPPLFEPIAHGDFLSYALAVEREIARQTEQADATNAEFAIPIAKLAERYSPANEMRGLEAFVQGAIERFRNS